MAENNQPIIIDASVAMKWFVDEIEDVDKALMLRDRALNGELKVGIISLIFYEVMNTLSRKWPEKAMPSISVLMMFHFDEFSLNLKIAYIALEIMQKCPKVSFYDASYHATAIENNGTFITADEGYYQKAKSFKHIKLLKDYQ